MKQQETISAYAQTKQIDENINDLLDLRIKIEKGETDNITMVIQTCDESTGKCSVSALGSGKNIRDLIANVLMNDDDLFEVYRQALQYVLMLKMKGHVKDMTGEDV